MGTSAQSRRNARAKAPNTPNGKAATGLPLGHHSHIAAAFSPMSTGHGSLEGRGVLTAPGVV
jgi:hypothetical protein